MDAGRTLAALIFFALLSSSALAHAHGVELPKRDALLIKKDRVSIRVQYVVANNDEARVLLRLFDRDRSSSLDAPERDALRAHLCRQATSFLRLELDGKPLSLIEDHAELGSDLASVDIILSAPLIEKQERGRHQLRLFDRHKDRRVVVPVRVTGNEVRIVSQLPPLTMLDAGQALEVSFEVTAQ